MVELEMPREYVSHPVMKQIRCVKDEANLQDAEINFKSSGTSLRANRFLLCLSSSVMCKMICGDFSECMAPRLELEEVAAEAFSDVMNLWCGREVLGDKPLGDVMRMASVADWLGMTEVITVLEDAIIGQLSVDVCGDVLMGSVGRGLGRVEAAARGLALERFEEVAATEGFMRMDEGTVGSLLDDDGLCVSWEEAVLEAVVGWMKGGVGKLRGRGLLGKIRYCVMDSEYLDVDVHRLLPAEYADWIEGPVLEALRVKAAGTRREPVGVRLLGERAHVGRPWPGVRWGRYGSGGERRVRGHQSEISALAECEGRMCSGSWDGTIHVWGGANLELKRTLCNGREVGESVHCLAVWEGHLISGHGNGDSDGLIRVWNMATGLCDQVLEGHTDMVRCLAVCGTRLVSGSDDYSVKVWAIAAMGAGAGWACERTLGGHDCYVRALATWQGKVLSGSFDASIRVWDVGTGAHDATLTGHEDSVDGLAVHGDRLFSASHDGTIREWAMGTWAALRTVEAYELADQQVPYCLAVLGSKLISGSVDSEIDDKDQQYEVLVWDLETLECEHTLLQPGGSGVRCLAAVRGQVWGGVGNEVVVWGRG